MKNKLFIFIFITILVIILQSCGNSTNNNFIEPDNTTIELINISPDNGIEDLELDYLFTWEQTILNNNFYSNRINIDDIYFNIFIGDQTNTINIIKEKTKDNFIVFDNLDYNKKYYWKITILDEKDIILDEMEIKWFKTEKRYYDEPSVSLGKPENNSIIEIGEISFDWEGFIGEQINSSNRNVEVIYDFYLQESDMEFTNPIQNDLIYSYYTKNIEKYNTEYKWKVIIKQNDGKSQESEVFYFTTKEEPISNFIEYFDEEKIKIYDEIFNNSSFDSITNNISTLDSELDNKKDKLSNNIFREMKSNINDMYGWLYIRELNFVSQIGYFYDQIMFNNNNYVQNQGLVFSLGNCLSVDLVNYENIIINQVNFVDYPYIFNNLSGINYNKQMFSYNLQILFIILDNNDYFNVVKSNLDSQTVEILEEFFKE